MKLKICESFNTARLNLNVNVSYTKIFFTWINSFAFEMTKTFYSLAVAGNTIITSLICRVGLARRQRTNSLNQDALFYDSLWWLFTVVVFGGGLLIGDKHQA